MDLADTLKKYRYPFWNEQALQDALEEVLIENGIAYVRECILGSDRIDFVADVDGSRIAIECKVDGGPSAVLEQVIRYAEREEIGAVILVTSKRTHRFAKTEFQGKPFAVVWITGTL